MISDKRKHAAFEQVIPAIASSYAGCPGLTDCLAKVKELKLSIIANTPEPKASGKIGQQDFREALRRSIEKVFDKELGGEKKILETQKGDAFEKVFGEFEKLYAGCDRLDVLQLKRNALKASLVANCSPRTGAGKPYWDEFDQNLRHALRHEFLQELGEPKKAAATPLEIRLNDSVLKCFEGVRDGIRVATKGDFSQLPADATWDEILCLAIMVDGEKLAGALGLSLPDFHRQCEDGFLQTGRWPDELAQLWCLLYRYNRDNHWNEGVGFGEGEPGRIRAQSVYTKLREKLLDYDYLRRQIEKLPKIVAAPAQKA